MSRNSVKSPFVPQLKTTDISALLKHFKQPFLRTCTESMLIKLHVFELFHFNTVYNTFNFLQNEVKKRRQY